MGRKSSKKREEFLKKFGRDRPMRTTALERRLVQLEKESQLARASIANASKRLAGYVEEIEELKIVIQQRQQEKDDG